MVRGGAVSQGTSRRLLPISYQFVSKEADKAGRLECSSLRHEKRAPLPAPSSVAWRIVSTLGPNTIEGGIFRLIALADEPEDPQSGVAVGTEYVLLGLAVAIAIDLSDMNAPEVRAVGSDPTADLVDVPGKDAFAECIVVGSAGTRGRGWPKNFHHSQLLGVDGLEISA